MKKQSDSKERIVKSLQQLRYDFTDSEQLAAGKKLGEVGLAIRRLEEELASVKSQFKFKLDEQEAIKGKLESQVTTGYEHKLVPVTITLNKPRNGKKTIVREDTLAVVAVEEMSYAEKQDQLALDTPAATEVEELTGTPVLTDAQAKEASLKAVHYIVATKE